MADCVHGHGVFPLTMDGWLVIEREDTDVSDDVSGSIVWKWSMAHGAMHAPQTCRVGFGASEPGASARSVGRSGGRSFFLSE